MSSTDKQRSLYRTQYPANWAPNAPMERVKRLRAYFPQLDFDHVEALVESWITLPEQSDGGLLIVPKFEAMEKCVLRKKKGWQPFNVATEYLFEVMKEVFPGFADFDHSKIGVDDVGPRHMELFETTRAFLAQYSASVPGDVLVLPLQAGALLSVYETKPAREWMERSKSHVPADIFSVGCFALTDPTRFAEDALFADCSGTKMTWLVQDPRSTAPRSLRNFYLPTLRIEKGKLGFYCHHEDGNSPWFGSASFVLK